MRKVIIVLLLLMFLSLTFFPGCTAPGEDEQIIKSVIELEKNEYLLQTLQITFDDYSKNIEPLFTTGYDYMSKYNDKKLFVKIKNIFILNPINIDEISNIDYETLKKIREKYENQIGEVPIEDSSTLGDIEISKVYSNEDQGTKSVFVKQLDEHYNPKFNVMYYTRYIFRKDNDQWKISEVRPTQIMGYGSGEKEYSLSRKTELALFDEYNGEKVEYNTILRIEDIDKRG